MSCKCHKLIFDCSFGSSYIVPFSSLQNTKNWHKEWFVYRNMFPPQERVQYYLKSQSSDLQESQAGSWHLSEKQRNFYRHTGCTDAHRCAYFNICLHPKTLSSHSPIILLQFGLMFVNQGQGTPFSHNMQKTENIEEKILEAALMIFQQVTINCIKKKKRKPNQSSMQLS